jgi:hypothetical protein
MPKALEGRHTSLDWVMRQFDSGQAVWIRGGRLDGGHLEIAKFENPIFRATAYDE